MRKHKHGGDIYSGPPNIDFSANINPLGPPESVKQALGEAVCQIQNYPDVECRQLKKRLSKKEAVPEEWLVFGNGAAELIFALVFSQKPKKALLTAPGFAEYEEALRAGGCEVIFYSRTDDFGVEEDYLEQITEDLDLLFLCNPNNPTGNLLEKKFLEQVLARCRQMQVLMVVDECFLGFLENQEDYSIKEYLGEFPNLFLLSAFTKLYAMPGLRLGYGMCSSKKVLEGLAEVMQPWSVSVPAQMGGIAALDERDYVERTRKLVSRERIYLEGRLKSLGFTVYPAAANFIFFKGSKDLASRCLERGFLIRDCSNYRGLEKGYCRIAVRTRKENDALLQVLGDIRKTKEVSQKWQR